MEGDFSQRMGFRPSKPDIQLDNISDDLRTGLWNTLVVTYLGKYKPDLGSHYHSVVYSNRHDFVRMYYMYFIKKPVDQIPSTWKDFLTSFKHEFFTEKWHRIYSLVEFVMKAADAEYTSLLVTRLNNTMEREGSGYRIVDGMVCPITSAEEMAAVEEALEKGSAYSGISEHLGAAIRMLSDKQSPDYRNSIKESISAVESIARHITGDSVATLGQAIKVLERKHNLHESLKRAFSALYGYTNDADGIRHSLMDDGKSLTSADARFMLITCSAFINFVIDSTKD